MARARTSGGKTVGEIVRYVPAPEPAHAAASIVILTLLEIVFVVLFLYGLLFTGNSVEGQQMAAFWLAAAIFALAAILSVYRKFFVPDVLQVKLRKQKYEDLR